MLVLGYFIGVVATLIANYYCVEPKEPVKTVPIPLEVIDGFDAMMEKEESE